MNRAFQIETVLEKLISAEKFKIDVLELIRKYRLETDLKVYDLWTALKDLNDKIDEIGEEDEGDEVRILPEK